jgi:MinD-like ATPase involved in chromosome partitioning or flagellar assembly
LTAAVDALRRKTDGLLFTDTRPVVEEPEAEAARISDLVIIPVRPSPDDLEAVGETLKIIRRLHKAPCWSSTRRRREFARWVRVRRFRATPFQSARCT